MTIYDLFNLGWTVEPRSLYDEEGVEGWVWIDPEGNEHSTELGYWHEPPPLPDPLPIIEQDSSSTAEQG